VSALRAFEDSKSRVEMSVSFTVSVIPLMETVNTESHGFIPSRKFSSYIDATEYFNRTVKAMQESE
jgi:hypothetical protein